MSRRSFRFELAFVVLALASATVLAASEIPARPEQLKYGELVYEPPDGDAYRHELANGVVVYVAEDHTLPLVNVNVALRVGGFLDPAGKVGLAGLTATMLRQGGTARLSAADFDERVEFLAANISSNAGAERADASLNCITTVLDESLDLFFEMLRTPGFDADRLRVEKDNILEAMKQRNDDADDILRREWGWLLYGEGYFATREPTKADIDAITRDDLVAFHARAYRPENMIFAVSGDVDTTAVLARLESLLGAWQGSAEAVPWPPPQPAAKAAPGVYHVEKDIPQGKVRIGLLTKVWNVWDDPDMPAVQVMNSILGGSGFTSRITKRVRSDEGLAYHAGSVFGLDNFWPGDFFVVFQSKNPTVALAAKISLDEVAGMRSAPVSDEELATAQASLVDSFPRRFESAAQIAGTFATDEYLGRPHSYWQTWRPRISAVGKDDVKRVATTYLEPEDMVFLLVGKWSEIAPGDADKRASMAEFFGGKVQHLPLRDPLTLEPME